uniref:Uncharacterized protein n=1 Tax=Manihot esculenta TaxID=3983 RepID=A0A2C9U1Y6_MANES
MPLLLSGSEQQQIAFLFGAMEWTKHSITMLFTSFFFAGKTLPAFDLKHESFEAFDPSPPCFISISLSLSLSLSVCFFNVLMSCLS